jgi:uncharacterized protein YndB with AHSA1/START domain
MQRVHEASIEIQASPDVVWRALTDLSSFVDWNPYITLARGDLDVGAELVLEITPPDRDSFEVRPIVTTVDPPHELAFHYSDDEGDAAFRFDGEIRLTAIEGGCLLSHRQRFEGVLPDLPEPVLDRNELGIEMMNVALKALAERA